ncbi:MAG: tRNA (adenosine(37)-N6)-threonylcarbamoyltransferase complex ATPase subunit type 1 TsaE [Candidatus Omnitrophota bacterium]|nr:tRNA (adenosine(37)-N6)-threonylcarbamoyltransferase complex ATPase subunit type 1 TsaE [Candidatus Omnitrophota bacterium]
MNLKSKIQNLKSAGRQLEIVTSSIEETQALGERLGRVLRAGDVVALHGELGSGKTTLIQGIARGLGREPESIKSPTFVLMREHPGDVPLIHIDGYRLEGAPSVSWLDLDLIFSPRKITLIEWAERFAGLLPDDTLTVRLAHVSTNRRRFTVQSAGSRSQAIVAALHPSTVHADSGY